MLNERQGIKIDHPDTLAVLETSVVQDHGKLVKSIRTTKGHPQHLQQDDHHRANKHKKSSGRGISLYLEVSDPYREDSARQHLLVYVAKRTTTNASTQRASTKNPSTSNPGTQTIWGRNDLAHLILRGAALHTLP